MKNKKSLTKMITMALVCGITGWGISGYQVAAEEISAGNLPNSPITDTQTVSDINLPAGKELVVTGENVNFTILGKNNLYGRRRFIKSRSRRDY